MLNFSPSLDFYFFYEFAQSGTTVYCFSVLFLIILFTAYRAFQFMYITKCSTKLHNNLLSKILYSHISTFEKVGFSGVIANLFLKDTDTIDDRLGLAVGQAMQLLLYSFISMILGGIVHYSLYLIALVIVFCCIYARAICAPAIRKLRRLEAATKSPMLAHIKTSISGLDTIRAFGLTDGMIEEFNRLQDQHTLIFSLQDLSMRTLGFMLDMYACVFEFITIGLVVFLYYYFDQVSEAGKIGLIITKAMAIHGAINWGVRQSIEAENGMVSVERQTEMMQVPQEDVPDENRKKVNPHDFAFADNSIEFKNVVFKYNETTVALNDLSFKVSPGQKVGIIGRTGAGKSSILYVLFRLRDIYSGEILIGGQNIKHVKLKDLRRSIAYIPQEPFLFAASVRENLDPFSEYNDADIIQSLQQCSLDLSLDFQVKESGGNLSVGQRQLICLARALLTKSKILVIDEATANGNGSQKYLIVLTFL